MTQQELELPKGWTKSQFDKCISYIIGGDWGEPFKDKIHDDFVKVQVLRSTELKNWKKERGSTAETRIIKKSSLDKRQLHDGNIILEISGGGTKFPVGRSVLIDNSILKNFDVPIICSNFFRKITLEEFLDPVYASNFLDYNYSTGLTIKFKKQSVNIQNLNTNGYLSSLLLSIPSLNEQKRIASKIEELFSKIDSTKQLLEYTKLQLEQYRFSLLKSLFEGKEWKKIKIGDHLNFQYGKGLPKKDRKQGKIPVYGSSGIAGYHNKALVETSSLIIGRKGSAGSVHLVDQPFWPIDTTYFIEETTIYNLKFLYHLLTHLRLGSLDSSTAIPSLRRDDVYALEIPLPSIEEQEQIVSQIEQNFSLVENSQRIVNSTLQTLETMRMSVLKQAFEGKLVPQDPNDEPAEILLERIKKERDALESKNKLKRSGRFRS